MSAVESEVYLVLMEYDEQYERLKKHSEKGSTAELEKYVSNKHDMLLENTLEAGSYQKRFSWVIIDGFVVEMSSHQAEMLRSAEGVRVVEKDKELKPP
ncbi:subtilisin-like protease SBT2.5 [Cryptomeria japonica]|uniref:subtilisin-like protease SBT2.5 n=1 Tax=Cryptomeria japonica TaxID=3369 RepID=UPI0025AC8C83|nr:subtilisin-like protease SBT2.5 [Cryptomeria japonica]XP_057817275.1 subtilisin-like protease SBT2.5 [Cryptomeria japonica]XP_057817276.1 subtilisin-like protease SBT2.5 [Cryptomeria japonica]XP_057817277.1 subtilisin-like protease SBT2.5 [Cryptomeria japonica]XP_057817279.1 subtilisin-like protease SBT2.5 [Cryptomeria japonica]